MNRAELVSLLGGVPLVGQVLRTLARFYAEGSVVRIRQGAAAGFRWKRHHRYVNGYWIGHYELPIQSVMRRELSPGQVFYDVGANAGFFTLVAARLVGAAGKCVAFDPLPENFESIREQIELNSLSTCTAVQEAVAAREGCAWFSFTKAGDSQGRLGGAAQAGEREIEVKVTSVDAASERFGEPDFIKVDVEGAEADVLNGATHVLSNVRPKWLVELHGPECERQVRSILSHFGYSFFSLEGHRLAPGSTLPRHFLAMHA